VIITIILFIITGLMVVVSGFYLLGFLLQGMTALAVPQLREGLKRLLLFSFLSGISAVILFFWAVTGRTPWL
jgi:hypothetical protein